MCMKQSENCLCGDTVVAGSKQCEDWVVNESQDMRRSIREGWQGASWATSGDGGCGPSGEPRGGGKS